MPNQSIDALLQTKANQANFEGFLPDRGVFDAQIQAQLDQYLAQLPIAQEQFNADLARRGIYSSGEAPKYLYSDVYAPIARAGAQAITQGNLQFSQLQQQGAIAGANLQLGYAGLWSQRDLYQEQIRAQRQEGFWGAIGNIVGTGVGAYAALQTGGASRVAQRAIQS